MIAIYTEKADVGNKVAAALGGFVLPNGVHINFSNRAKYEEEIKKYQRSQGFLDIEFQGKPCRVTWGYGHMYGLQDVPEYNPAYKSWKARPVCFIPDEFKLHPITSSLANFNKTLTKQRRIIKETFRKAEYVINATDYDREGELIFAYVCEAVGYRKPFYRVLFTSQTESGIKDAFDHLIDSKDVASIEKAGRARSIYDWVIGTNMSTQMTLRFPGNNVLSIGRVQTPVLKMVVDREEAIASFVPKVSWNIKGTFHVGDETYSGLYKGNGDMDKTTADSIVSKIAGQEGNVTALDKKKTKKEVPLLYSQTSLQIDASKYFGYTAKETLDAAQFLYENGYTSYPRTKSQYLTDDMRNDVIATLKKLSSVPEYQKFLTGISVDPGKKFFNSAKVISHFAIIPTGEVPKKLSVQQKNIYDLIVWSLIRTIYPDAILEKTSVTTQVDGKYDFTTSGTTIVDPGWLIVNVKTKEAPLPSLALHARYPGSYEGKETKTEPPKRYDDGSLVKAMKTAGKDLDNAAFRAILANPDVEGIGTDATRAEIIETLVRRQYVERKGKLFYATQKGIDLIHAIPIPDMMSPEFTARMEQQLLEIEKGELDYGDFLKQAYRQANLWASTIASYKGPATFSSSGAKASSSTSAGRAATPKGLKCPNCGAEMDANKHGWFCSANCGVKLFNTMLSHKITAKEAKSLFTKGQTGLIEDFISKKTGKKFSAKLVWNKSKNQIEFDFGK